MPGEYEVYHPGPVPFDPKEIPRYVDDELHRIMDLKEDRGLGAITAVERTEALIPIENPPGTWNQLFVGQTEILDIPDGAWDPVTGLWTAPFGGFFDVELELEWFNIGTQGGGFINFFAGISIDGVNPPGVAVQMDVPVGTTATVVGLERLIPLSAGQTLGFFAEALSTQTTQTADLTAGVLIEKRN